MVQGPGCAVRPASGYARRLATALALIAALVSTGRAQTPQTPAAPQVDPARIEKFVKASAAEREAMFAAEKDMAELPFRRAMAAIGNEFMRRGDLRTGEEIHRAVLWIADRIKLPAARATSLISVSSAVGQQGDHKQSEALLLEALTIAESLNDVAIIQSALANLGIVQRLLGDSELAIKTLNRALAIAETFPAKEAASRVLNNLGITYMYLGDGLRARDYYTRSLALKVDDGGQGSQDMARTIGNAGALLAEQGDYEQALDHYQRALAILERSGGGTTLPAVISNIGNAHAALGRDDLALPYYERALPLAKANNDRRREATIYYNLANLRRNAGKYAEAEALQLQSLAIREQLGEPNALMESTTELASLAVALGREADGLAYAQRSVALGAKSRMLQHLWKAQLTEAEILNLLGRTEEAVAGFTASINTVEALRRMTAGGDRAQQLYFAQRLGPYYGLAGVHAAAGRGYDAFATVERARARALLDILGSGGRARGSLSDTERARERELTEVVLSVASQIAIEGARPGADQAKLAQLDDKLAQAQRARDAYVADLYEARPDLRLARGEAPVVSRDKLAALVPAGTAIVSFVIDRHYSWSYLIKAGSSGEAGSNSNARITTRKLSIDAEALSALADKFATEVATRDLRFSATAKQLYTALFGDIDRAGDLAGVRNLIIVPDGALWRVPFQALQTPGGSFLIELRALSYSPSVSALAALEERRRSRPVQPSFLLALGDPATDPSGSADNRGGDRGRLPEAAREVRALGKLYGASKSAVLVAGDASEKALRERVSRASIVHVATHGVFDDRNPMYSHLLLTPGDKADVASDGRLEAWELMDLGITADLAVLSACETARGRLGDGEGVIGLSWSLFAAGASTAVVSQWAVDSASTTSLMIAFHERLLRTSSTNRGNTSGAGRTTAPDALRAASLALMKNPSYRHPFYWAGFIVMGAK
jgi:CHAT domain-containing protein/tetratricopeptide (TPR) repeat protein